MKEWLSPESGFTFLLPGSSALVVFCKRNGKFALQMRNNLFRYFSKIWSVNAGSRLKKRLQFIFKCKFTQSIPWTWETFPSLPVAGAPTAAHPTARWIFSVLVVYFHPLWNQSFAGLDPYFQLLRKSCAVPLPFGTGHWHMLWLLSTPSLSDWKKTQFPKKLWSIAWRISLLLHLCLSRAEVESRNKPNLFFSGILASVALQLQINQGIPQLCKRGKGFSIH